MPRLFISHSSKDNVAALAFQRWLIAGGWDKEDVFIDLHGIGAGERWRDTLRKANASCEAVVLLASPDSLGSPECLREINLAEDLGKEILIAILRDLTPADPRLARWADRQFVDLSAEPQERMEPFEHEGQLHRVHFHLPALNAIAARLVALGIAPGSFAWAPATREAGPYPGLAAFGEDDAGIFFGREADIMVGLTKLRLMRRRRGPRLLVIQAASGAGKSSFLRAGLWPRLKRDPDFAPLAIVRPALGIMTGPEGLGRRIAPFFAHFGHTAVPGEINARLTRPGPEAAEALASILTEATALATVARRAGMPDVRAPAPLIALDQGEEMFAAEYAAESQRFLALLAAVLKQPPALAPAGRAEHGARDQESVDPYVLVTIRADSVDALLQRWPALGLENPESMYLAPLAPSAYRDVIVKPAQVYTSRVRRLEVEPALADQLARDATGADALPLLAFTLEKLFHEFGADGNLTLARYDGMGGTGGSIDRALAEAQRQAGPAGSLDKLRRLVVPGLATWDPAASAAKRLVAEETHLLAGDRAALGPLANALVANRLLTRGAGTLEVAHEALLRREPIGGWLEAQKDALKLRDDVVREAREWADAGRHDKDVVRRGARLDAAQALAADADYTTALTPSAAYLAAGRRLDLAATRGARRTRAAIFTLMLGVIGALLAVIFKAEIEQLAFTLTTERSFIANQISPHVLTAEAERALKPGSAFRECAAASNACPEMVVLPAGTFVMGSPDGKTPIIGPDGKPKPGPLQPVEAGRYAAEGPQHEVKVSTFAVGRFGVTWDEWEVCVAMRGCDGRPTGDASFGKGRKPVINVTWDQAKAYAQWLSRMTGKDYRLLSEAEREYAARGVTSTEAPHPAYPWGDDEICKHANLADKSYKQAGYTGEAVACDDGEATTAKVGTYPANAFGLHDLHGNVWEWTEDCFVDNYANAPKDGSAVTSSDCVSRVVRGGSWDFTPQDLRSAQRNGDLPVNRLSNLGFRLARTLHP